MSGLVRVLSLGLLALTAGSLPATRVQVTATRPASAAVAGLSGRVVNPSGQPVAGVQVHLISLDGDASGARAAVTDTSGAFAWSGLSAGNYEFTARRVGFSPVDASLVLADGVNRTVTVRIEPIALLDTVRTHANASGTPDRYGPSSRMDDFYASMRTGMGKFFTRDKLDSMTVFSAADVITGVPGLSVFLGTGSSGTKAIVSSVACRGHGDALYLIDSRDGWGGVALVIDGIVIHGDRGSAFDRLGSSDIEALAVYQGMAELPPELSGMACAAVYVWTRSGASLSGKKP